MNNKLRSAWHIMLAVLLSSTFGCSGGEGTDAGTADAGTADAGTGAGDPFCGALPSIDRASDGPASLLDGPIFADRPADLGIHRSSFEVDVQTIDGRDFHMLRFAVTTFTDRFGRDWVSGVLVIAPAPDDLAATDAAAAIAQAGTLNGIASGGRDPTWGTRSPDWFMGTESSSSFVRSYGSVARDYGIPVVFASPVPFELELDPGLVAEIQRAAASNGDPCDDAVCEGVITNDGIKMDCLLRALFVRNDLTSEPYFNLAVAQSRTLDAAEQVLNEYYADDLSSSVQVDWSRIWSTGNSKRGHSQRFLAAVDSRVAGVVIGAADLSNFEAFFEQQLTLWSGGWSFNASEMLSNLRGPVGTDYLDRFDMFRWAPAVLDGVMTVVAVGTNDPLYPIGASLTYADSLPDTHRFLIVPNYGHGMGSVDHVAAFRALVDHGLNATPWPRVEARWAFDQTRVVAEVSEGLASEVELWCSTALGENAVGDVQADCSSLPMPPEDNTDLRHAVWTMVSMTEVETGRFEAMVPSSSLSYPVCLVRARTADDKVSTSGPLLSRALCEAAGLPGSTAM